MGVNIASSIDNLPCQDITLFSTLQWNYFLVENEQMVEDYEGTLQDWIGLIFFNQMVHSFRKHKER